jgi:3,4-dihydroxy 2-butanone 4-phosphate synthase / GTP cyclohydrolase II
VTEQVPLEVVPNPHNTDYLRTKREKMGHLFPPADALGEPMGEQAA